MFLKSTCHQMLCLGQLKKSDCIIMNITVIIILLIISIAATIFAMMSMRPKDEPSLGPSMGPSVKPMAEPTPQSVNDLDRLSDGISNKMSQL
jgi:flagellar basal body-associated protein FliL